MSQSEPATGPASSARPRNLSRLLTLTHREGPQSRAALTRRTGLNRSTIGGLVAELSARGLVSETGPAGYLRVSAGTPSEMALLRDALDDLNPPIEGTTP